MEKVFLKGVALLARHSETALFVVALIAVALFFWLTVKMWRNRTHIGVFVRWFVGATEENAAREGRSSKRHGIVVLFFDILALGISSVITAILVGICVGVPGAILEGIFAPVVYGKATTMRDEVRAMTCEEFQTGEESCSEIRGYRFCVPIVSDEETECLEAKELAEYQAQEVMSQAHSVWRKLERAGAIFLLLLGVLAFLFIAPRVFRKVFRLVHHRYLE